MTDTSNQGPGSSVGALTIRIGLPLLPLLIAAALAWMLPRVPDQPWLSSVTSMTPVQASSPERLDVIFAEYGYQWPPTDPIPPLSLTRFPNGMEALGADERKSLFFRSLLPLVLFENERITVLREHFLPIHQRLNSTPGARLGPREQALVDQLWARYRMEGNIRDRSTREQLLLRLDTVPPSLALAQAANESGWGTSRFTREANNLFGEWTWNEDIGLLPQRRVEGATHFVRKFPDLHASVRSYIHNLNIGRAYSGLRQLRANIRQQGETPDGLTLAGGLEQYSERGQAYIREVRSMIRQNGLHELPEDLRLGAGKAEGATMDEEQPQQ